MLNKDTMEIDGYKVIREVSQGAISTVYLGEQTSLHRQVLIKRLNTQWSKEPDLLERFRREAIICARLKHPNIVDIIDVNTQSDNLYLIIEFIEGRSLEELIKSHHPLPVDLIIFISREILSGLNYAHSKGVLHRDIKPSNIMISNEGRVKIADFGLAKVEDLPPISMHGEVVGTPAYMSPEQARVSRIDQRSDLFSLGVAFYELASGQPSPFQGENIVASVQKLIKLNPAPLAQIRPDIPPWYSDLVEQMLKKNPAHRPASAEEILQRPPFQNISTSVADLAAFIADPQNYAAGQPEVEAAQQKPRRSGKLFAGVSAAVLVVILLGIFGLNSSFFSGDEPQQPSLAEVNQAEQGLTVIQTGSSEDSALTKQNAGAINNGEISEQTAALADRGTEQSSNRDNAPAEKIPPVSRGGEQTAGASEPPASHGAAQNDDALLNLPREKSGPEALPARPGGVMVACSPWAHVFIDGKQRDTTPFSEPLLLPPGTHVLELKNPQFQTYRDTISISAGKIDSISVKLTARSGFVMLHVLPWAKVYIDGKYLETTPFAAPQPLPVGKHEIRLMNPAFKTFVDSIEITPGETLEKRITLTRD